ncbi:MAG: ShlB/FhaC/HecB family hemolysin secretion/activation protein [Candidatus Deferrimicrobium sp.]
MRRRNGGIRGEQKRFLLPFLLVFFLTPAVLAWPEPAHAGPGSQVPEDASGNTFEIKSFEVSGNTLFPEDNVAAALAVFTGPGKTAADVEKARDALESLYHGHGYPTVLVNIPEQAVVEGRIRLEAIESRIDEIKVIGNRYFSAEQILEKLPSMAPGKIIYIPQIRQEVGKINRNPDLKIAPSMTPSKDIGYVDVEIKAKDRLPLHGSLEINNRASHDTTSLRANAVIRYGNLWKKGHSISFQFQTSPEKPSEAEVFSGSYLLPIRDSDAQLAFYAVRSNSDTGFGEGFQTVGKGTIVGTRYMAPLPPFGSYSHSYSVGLDYKNFEERVGFADGGPGDKTPISYLPFSLGYNASIEDDAGTTQFNAGLSMAFRGAVTDQKEFDNKTVTGRANYLVLTLGGERNRKLPAGFSLYAKLDGQISSQPLISNEQYSAGGMESVRGYKESEALGDDAVHGSVEFRGFPVDLSRVRFLPFLFIDAAVLWPLHPPEGQVKETRLLGTGGGIRGALAGKFEYEADGAVALSDTSVTRKNRVMANFRIKYQF